MNTEEKKEEIQLSKEEKQAIMDAREKIKQEEKIKKSMREFHQELEELCKKHRVTPQLANSNLLQIVQLLPEAVNKQKLVWKKIED